MHRGRTVLAIFTALLAAGCVAAPEAPEPTLEPAALVAPLPPRLADTSIEVTVPAGDGWAATHFVIPTEAWDGNSFSLITEGDETEGMTLLFEVYEGELRFQSTLRALSGWGQFSQYGGGARDIEFVVVFIGAGLENPATIRIGPGDANNEIPSKSASHGTVASGTGAVLAWYRRSENPTNPTEENHNVIVEDARAEYAPGVHSAGALKLHANASLAQQGLHGAELYVGSTGPRAGAWSVEDVVDGASQGPEGSFLETPRGQKWAQGSGAGVEHSITLTLDAFTPALMDFLVLEFGAVPWDPATIGLPIAHEVQAARGSPVPDAVTRETIRLA